jgi:hypothetical protein
MSKFYREVVPGGILVPLPGGGTMIDMIIRDRELVSEEYYNQKMEEYEKKRSIFLKSEQHKVEYPQAYSFMNRMV